MKEAIAIVLRLTEVQAVSLLKQLNRNLFTAVPFQQVQTHLPTGRDDVIVLRNLDLETKKQYLNPLDSVRLTKHLLMTFAQDDDLAPALMQAWEEIKHDGSLFIENIVAIELLANLALLVATAEIEFKVGRLKIRKNKVDPETLNELMNPIAELVKKTD